MFSAAVDTDAAETEAANNTVAVKLAVPVEVPETAEACRIAVFKAAVVEAVAVAVATNLAPTVSPANAVATDEPVASTLIVVDNAEAVLESPIATAVRCSGVFKSAVLVAVPAEAALSAAPGTTAATALGTSAAVGAVAYDRAP